MSDAERFAFCGALAAAASHMRIYLRVVQPGPVYEFGWTDSMTFVDIPCKPSESRVEAFYNACEALQGYLKIQK